MDYFPNKLGFRSSNSAVLPFGSTDNTDTACVCIPRVLNVALQKG